MPDDDASVRTRERWDALIRSLGVGQDVYSRALLTIAEQARANDRLSRLFPFASLNRLCFSRCSEWPFTRDCPSIGASGAGQYRVATTCYPEPRLDDGSYVTIGDETADPAMAVTLAAAQVPPDVVVWLGSATDSPHAPER